MTKRKPQVVPATQTGPHSVEVEIGGIAYRLCVSVAGMIGAERAASTPGHDVTWDGIMRAAQAGSARHFVIFARSLFTKHHPTVTEADVAELIDQAGGADAFGALIAKVSGRRDRLAG